MKLVRIEQYTGEPDYVVIHFTTDQGIPATLTFPASEVPEVNRLEWARQRIIEHLKQIRYEQPGEMLYDLAEEAWTGMDNLPGWATWSADEAEAWIEANVMNLATAKTALKAMAKAIVYLRDITVERR